MRVPAARYPAVVGIALVASGFAVVFCALLVWDYTRRAASDPLESQQLLALRTQLQQRPGDQRLQEAARSLDLQLRQQYFRQRRFTARGAYLLLAAVSVALIALALPRPCGESCRARPSSQPAMWTGDPLGGGWGPWGR